MRPRKLKLSAFAFVFAVALVWQFEAKAADTVVRHFEGGDGQNAVGIVEASEDTEIDGPQALTTDEDGHVYLLDQVNNRIVSFDPKAPSVEPRVQAFPDQLQPTD